MDATTEQEFVPMAHDPGLLPFSPQLVRKTFVNAHQLPTVEMGICAGQRVMPPLTNGTHLCGNTPTRSSSARRHRPMTTRFPFPRPAHVCRVRHHGLRRACGRTLATPTASQVSGPGQSRLPFASAVAVARAVSPQLLRVGALARIHPAGVAVQCSPRPSNQEARSWTKLSPAQPRRLSGSSMAHHWRWVDSVYVVSPACSSRPFMMAASPIWRCSPTTAGSTSGGWGSC